MQERAGIFLLRGEDELLEMRESAYEAEHVLQALIARFPSLLAGDQYPDDAPRRWLLVAREAALPDDQDAAGRWSVDHSGDSAQPFRGGPSRAGTPEARPRMDRSPSH